MAFDLDGRPFWKKHFGCIALTLIGLALIGATIFLLTYRYETTETLTLEELAQKYPVKSKSHLTNESILSTLEIMLSFVPADRVKVWEKATALTRHNLAYKKWIEEMDTVFSHDVSDDTIRKIMRDPFLTTTDYTK